MTTATRTQRRYDHRLRSLVRTTQDVRCAVQRGVPRSTARDWLRETNASVVTIDTVDTDSAQLQREALLLRRRVQKLIALLRVFLVGFRLSGYTLNQVRLPEGNNKRSLLRAIKRSRSALSLRALLRVVRLSPVRYHAWSREDACALDDRSSCPRSSPQQLTAADELRLPSPDHDCPRRHSNRADGNRRPGPTKWRELAHKSAEGRDTQHG